MGALDLWAVAAALYGGGILGDNCSYWMGRYYGTARFERLSHRPLVGGLVHMENHPKGVEFFRRRGAMAVFTARPSGPLSWATPALAGMFRLSYLTFLRFNTPAIIIGIGEFVLAGYFFGNRPDAIRAWLEDCAAAAGLAAAGLIMRHRLGRRAKPQRTRT